MRSLSALLIWTASTNVTLQFKSPHLDGTFKLNIAGLYLQTSLLIYTFLIMHLSEFQITSQCTWTSNRDYSYVLLCTFKTP